VSKFSWSIHSRFPSWCVERLKRNWFYDVNKSYDKKKLVKRKGGGYKEDNKRI
jgi:hypothetical protein